MEPTIKITIIGNASVSSKLSKHVTESIDEANTYKYTYLKQLVTRLRRVEERSKDLPDNEHIIAIGNTLIAERNIAAYAAEQYAALNQDELFDSFVEIMEEIEELFKQ